MNVVIGKQSVYIRAAYVLLIQIEHGNVRIILEYHTGNNLVAELHILARAVLLHILAHFNDFTGSLMTERNRDQAERIALKLMRVRAAYAAALNLNQNIIIADLRNRIFLQFKILGLCQHRNPCGLRNPRFRRSRRFVAGHSRKYLPDNFFYIHRINVHLNSSFLLTDAQAV